MAKTRTNTAEYNNLIKEFDKVRTSYNREVDAIRLAYTIKMKDLLSQLAYLEAVK